jgi:type I restriction enzyme, R subunit
MSLSEADTRARLIDPALYARGWKEGYIKREETAGAVAMRDGKAHRCSRGRMDYTLRIKVAPDLQPVAVALTEAKAESLPPGHGLEHGKQACKCPVYIWYERTFTCLIFRCPKP